MTRLDRILVERGLVKTRSQGREFILAGRVIVDGEVCLRPARTIGDADSIRIDGEASVHRVGRGYDKLRRFIAEHPVDFAGRHVVDGGASTGGFTQLALERGAASVLAVERGAGQLAAPLRADPRVVVREDTDLRDLRETPAPVEILMLDLSFVSLREVMPAIALPLAPGALLVALVKPQFELPAAALTRAGRVRRAKDCKAAIAAATEAIVAAGWRVVADAPVEPGPDQVNREHFILAACESKEGRP